MNLDETTIYHPVTLDKYSLYFKDGQELLRQLLKSYSLQDGGATKKKKRTSGKRRKNKKTSSKRHKNKEQKKKEMFFNKELPDDYRHTELTNETKSFLNTYKKKSKSEIMKYLSEDMNNKFMIPRELLDVYNSEKLSGPDIKPEHIYNPCMPIKWQDEFLSTKKLIKEFFKKHSNSVDVTKELKKILKEDAEFEEEVDEPVYKQTAEEVLNRLFQITAINPFQTLSMDELAESVFDIIEETIAAFSMLKTPTFNVNNEFDRQLILYYINYYSNKFYIPILNVLNKVKLVINDSIKQMKYSYKKQNLTEDNIDENLKIIVVGNNTNYVRIMEKIMRFRQYISNKKKEALESPETSRYTEPIPYYACVKVDILGEDIFTLSGDQDLLYLTTNGEIKDSIKSMINNTSENLIYFYGKKQNKPEEKLYINDSLDKLNKYYDISLEMYIYKLLVEDKIQPK